MENPICQLGTKLSSGRYFIDLIIANQSVITGNVGGICIKILCIKCKIVFIKKMVFNCLHCFFSANVRF